MSDRASIDQMDDQTILLILSHVTQELQEDLSQEQLGAIRSQDEARAAIVALLNAAGENTAQLDAAQIIPEDEENPALSRGVLELLLNDEVAKPKAEELLTNPPEEEQMSVALALGGAIILGTLITWLQTKIKLKVSRKDGKTDFEFEMDKDKTDPETIKEVAKAIITLLGTTPL
ncbi:MAG TPA: hypothetical protein VKY19_19710 [Ktedonosporobacter sp.]|jgi:hypothetical protein|nr:hypothetical protein [Ktedonosporobacter sp.]